MDGIAVNVGWDGTYSFAATKESYEVVCNFGESLFTGGDICHWDLTKHRMGELMVKSHSSGHSGYIDYVGTCNDVTMVVKDHSPNTSDFNMQYRFTFSNGETFFIRINHEDSDGVYRIQSIKTGNTLFSKWTNKHDFTSEETAAITGEGIKFRVIILGNAAHVYLNDVKVCVYEFTKDVGDATATVTFRMNGNLNNDVYIAYEITNTDTLQ